METKKMSDGTEVPALFQMSRKEIETGAKESGTDFYTKEGVKINIWGTEENTKKEYICEVNKDKTHFIGLLNSRLQRDNLGLSRFDNGEIYFGYYQKDLRDKHGLYVFNPKKAKGKVNSEFYWGLWKDNIKDTRGAYLWLTEDEGKKPFTDFDSASFDLYVGDIKFESLVKGVYMVKKGEEYYVYYGGFDDYGNKQGDECYYYNASNDMILYGKVENNHFVSGYLTTFDEEGKAADILKVEFGDDHKISDFEEKESIEESARADVEKKTTAFRASILEEDYFGMAYNSFRDLMGEIEKVKLESFVSEEDFPHLMNIMTGYNRLGMLENIQRVLK